MSALKRIVPSGSLTVTTKLASINQLLYSWFFWRFGHETYSWLDQLLDCGHQAMADFVKWVKKAVLQAVDPHKEPRQKLIAQQIWRRLSTERQKFSIDRYADSVEHHIKDIEAAARIVYRRLLDNAWSDRVVSDAEKRDLKLYAGLLGIPPDEMRATYQAIAKSHFAVVFAQAMEDGRLDAEEVCHLETITSSVGLKLNKYVQVFFQNEGTEFLAGLFDACTSGRVITADAWDRLINISEQLGFSESQICTILRPRAKEFIEHQLADEEIDHRLSNDELVVLSNLVEKFRFPQEFTTYVARQILALNIIRNASQGILKNLSPPPGIAIRSGELIYFSSEARFIRTRLLKSGPQQDRHAGSLVVTDNRLLFSSTTTSFDAKLANVIKHGGRTGAFQLQFAGKPEATFLLAEERPVAYAILEAAIKLANRTIVQKSTEGSTRHIPRDVRQRVWQRCGGKCADCGANDYLEFDHVVPVARGGSNSDLNVQLLCRRCNLKKSDFI